MGNSLNSPITEKKSNRIEVNGLDIGMSGMQGWRFEMEDDEIAVGIDDTNHTFVGVFDGHGGAGAAHYAAEHIVEFLKLTEEWGDYLQSLRDDDQGGNIELLKQALVKTFEQIDIHLRQKQEDEREGADNQRVDTSGCTSVTAVITPKYIICANAGDSRCILGSNSEVIAMSEDHKPTDRSERERIETAGGTVQFKRVDGDLAVSRAFGDFQYKNKELNYQLQKVTCHPDIRVHERTPGDEFLLLACDGLWDVMTNQAAYDRTKELFQLGESDVSLVAEEMLDTALELGSKDNISCIVVKFPGCEVGEGGGVTALRQSRETLVPKDSEEEQR